MGPLRFPPPTPKAIRCPGAPPGPFPPATVMPLPGTVTPAPCPRPCPPSPFPPPGPSAAVSGLSPIPVSPPGVPPVPGVPRSHLDVAGLLVVAEGTRELRLQRPRHLLLGWRLPLRLAAAHGGRTGAGNRERTRERERQRDRPREPPRSGPDRLRDAPGAARPLRDPPGSSGTLPVPPGPSRFLTPRSRRVPGSAAPPPSANQQREERALSNVTRKRAGHWATGAPLQPITSGKGAPAITRRAYAPPNWSMGAPPQPIVSGEPRDWRGIPPIA